MTLGRKGVHVDADLDNDDLGAEIANAGDGAQDLDRGANGLEMRVDLLIDLSDGGVDPADMLEAQPQYEPMRVALTRPRSAASSSACDALIRRWARAANANGSASPAIKTSIILLPESTMMSVMTESSLMLASSSVFWIRWT